MIQQIDQHTAEWAGIAAIFPILPRKYLPLSCQPLTSAACAATPLCRVQLDSLMSTFCLLFPCCSNSSKESMDDFKWREIRNGRLAMVAFLGFVAQHAATGKGPLDNLAGASWLGG